MKTVAAATAGRRRRLRCEAAVDVDRDDAVYISPASPSPQIVPRISVYVFYVQQAFSVVRVHHSGT